MDLTDSQRKTMRHDRSFCVTAGAGGGKTRVLVEKYISLLESGVGVDQILALTFTEKAAAEMKERVRHAISEKKGEDWRKVEEEFHWASISTFHSFCARVLREHPFEVGIMPGFKVLEDMERGQLLKESLDHLVSHPPSGEVERPLTTLLIDMPLRTFETLMTSMYSMRSDIDQFLSSIGSMDDLADLWAACLERAREETVSRLRANGGLVRALERLMDIRTRLPGKEDAGTRYLVDIMLHVSVFLENDDSTRRYDSLLAISARTDRRTVGEKRNWDEQDREALNECRTVIADVLEKASLDDLDGDSERFVESTIFHVEDILTCFSAFRSMVDQAKKRMNALDFDDMISLVWDLLDRDPAVRMSYNRAFRYILVDEFQDTDRMQWSIVKMVLGEPGENERLFIVGDPKQSIYLFRGIDVSMFKEAREEVVDTMGGEPVHLDVCFRSTPEIVNLANRVFERLMPPSSRPFEFEYGRMEHSDQRADDRGSVELIVVDGGDRTARTEAELIAGRIRSMVDDGDKTIYWDGNDHLATPRPVRFGDMTILLRARTNLRFLEWALNRAGIPYHIHAGLGFYESQEVLDACNILSFLANERNDVALYGLLRSPYFAFSDEDLYRVSRSAHGSLWHSLNDYAGNSEDGRFKEASDLIGSWLKMAHRIPVSELLPKIVADSGIYAVYGGTVEGEQAIANVEKLMGIARNAREQGFSSLSRFMGWFDRAIREAPKEGHASLDLDSGDCVNIMTIHAAKGLEFPVVLVPEMSNLPWDFGDPILVDRELGLGTNVPDPDDSHRMKDTCARRIIKRRNEEKERAEYRRLLYVAMTRAKDHLVMSGREPEKYPTEMKDDGSWMELFLASTEIIEWDVEAGEKRVEVEGSIVPVNILRGRDILDIGLEVEREPLRPGDYLLEAIAASATDRPPRPQKERVLTASAIDQYMRCPRRFKAIHEMGLPEERIGISAIEETPARTGKIIHEVFRGNDPTAVLRRFGIDDPERAREYGEMRKRFLESDLMGDMVDERCELPIRFREGEHTYKGTVDRLVRTDEGWRIIDYKTGDVKPSELEKRAKEYAIQMAIYAQGVRRLLGISPRVVIYFPTCARSQEVVIDEDILADVATLAKMISRNEFDFEECAGCSRHSAEETLHGVCPALESLGINPSED